MKNEITLGLVDTHSKPFIGKVQVLIETIHSLDEKWYVELWDVHYFFLGIEIYKSKKEVVKSINGSKVGYRSKVR
ncbi:MAG: hypothetical protein RBT19_03040 [Tenuifilaceae bacterium]|jgi:hypothetical protein|nr:hypothetical protein [Tenuifilaceae bacterium]